MLIERQKDFQDQIVTLLLLSGQEVIGKLISKNEKEFILLNPRMPAVESNGSIGFNNIMATAAANDIVGFERDKVLCIGISDEKFKKPYMQFTGTK